ncbi:MAG: UMP kinase [Patescibacteria group bacterium]
MSGFFFKPMFSVQEPPVILSIGGSLIVPNGNIDHDFLKKLNEFVRLQVKKGRRFFLVAGGGMTARHYRDAGKAVIGNVKDDDLDWLGIHATHLNGHLLRTIFKDIAHPRVIQDYDRKLSNWKEPVVIGAGWKPGWSTDYDAVILARDYGANLIINLSNIDWVYDKDPKEFSDARPIEKMTWEEMQELVGTDWVPGSNAPFDPVASKLAKDLHLTVIVCNGKNFKNTSNILEGDSFKGTVLMPFRIDASFYSREYYKGQAGLRFTKRLPRTQQVMNSLINWYRAFLIRFFLNPKKCLDVGCGTGQLIKHLRAFGVDAYGIDISKNAIDLVDKEVKPYVKEGSITKLPYKQGEFDLVITYDVLQHIEQSKIRKAIQELIRVSNKYVLNKIYTKENIYMTKFHSRDFSRISVFTRKFWRNLFIENDKVVLLRDKFFRLPSFFETVFLLKKK